MDLGHGSNPVSKSAMFKRFHRVDCIQYICPHLRVGWVILLARGTPLVPTKEAGRGRELRGMAGGLALTFRGCGTKLLLGLRG